MEPLILGLPCYSGMIAVELAKFFYEAGQLSNAITIVPIKKRPTDVARNQLVSLAIRHQAHLIMVDHDAAPAPGTFTAIAEKIHSEECVAAVPYVSSSGSGICVGETSPMPKDVVDLEGWGLVDNCGTHCIGYNYKVFQKIQPPYFFYEYNAEHTSLAGWAEDTVCHRRLRDAGVPIYVNWSLWAGHLIPKIVQKPKILTEFERALVIGGL